MSSWNQLLEKSLADFEEAAEAAEKEKEAKRAARAATTALFQRQSQLPKKRVEGKVNERIALTGQESDEPAVLTIADCENCRIDVSAPCVKIVLNRVRGSKIRLRARVVTSVAELTRCTDTVLLVQTHLGTVQLDMSSQITVDFALPEHMESIWINRCEDVSVNNPALDAAAEHRLPIGHKIVELANNSWMEDQFRCRLRDGKLQTTIVTREDGGFIAESKEDEQETLREVRRVVNQAMAEKLSGASTGTTPTIRVDTPPAAAPEPPPPPPRTRTLSNSSDDSSHSSDDDDDDKDEVFEIE